MSTFVTRVSIEKKKKKIFNSCEYCKILILNITASPPFINFFLANLFINCNNLNSVTLRVGLKM